ncbi:helix-turn-helix domain-containing protein [Feifania hominis]|uniref:Helix-turn-helix transcriptional regulator n=1 Tax=Feifania hominis TaxID=2763660 RepID=A0A926DFA9_9FIRM|nr:helix-turn-helix transcriptional regulator [Feifania hominis]MBC8536754.1 helix-turn-helix transcriptional regulator [Feifania hominis]
MTEKNLEWYEIVGRNLRWLRAGENLSIAELSRRTGVSRGMLTRLEREEHVARFCVSHVKKLCDYFGVMAWELLESDLTRRRGDERRPGTDPSGGECGTAP